MSEPMEICLMFDPHDGLSWEDWRDLAATAEDSGLHGLFCGDHYSGPGGGAVDALDVWTALAALAPLTSVLRLGTLVSPLTFRHPSVIARIAVSVDQISGGRAELGLGTGWNESAHRRAGVPFPPQAVRFAMLDEQLEIITSSWRAEEFSFSGEHYVLEGQQARPLPVHGSLPLILGGSARRRGAGQAARYASEYNFALVGPEPMGPAEFGKGCRRLDAACEAVGRDPATLKRSIFTWGFVAADPDKADKMLRRMLELLGDDRDPDAVRADPGPWIFGSPEEVTEKLAPYREAGASRLYLKLVDSGDEAAVHELGEYARAVSA
ncbi:MAG: LLM class flavin-dependent oxidoreductase [Solirubrobacterales bacterium]